MSTNVFEHPFLKGLMGAPQISRLFGVEEDIAAMLKFEVALAVAQGGLGLIPQSAAANISDAAQNFQPDISKLNEATARDGVVVPELITQFRLHVGDGDAGHVHIGVTSQDVIDTSMAIRLKSALKIMAVELQNILHILDEVNALYGSNQIMVRTRMQNASQTNVANQIRNWRSPLEKLAERERDIANIVGQLQLGGPTGDRSTFGEQYPQLAARVAEQLDLVAPPNCWHTDRTSLSSLANWLSELTGCLGKIGRDICLQSMNEIAEIKLSGTGGSSSMAHKQNPVKAEILVALANFNATQLPAMHHSLVHENNRSGSMWTLEWMILPQMMTATAASLRVAGDVLANLEKFGNSG